MQRLREYFASKRFLYCLCFLMLMVIDWTRGSQIGIVWASTVNLSGLVVAVIVGSAFSLKSFMQRKYIFFSMFCMICIVAADLWWQNHSLVIFRGQLFTALLNIWAIGVLAIRIYEYYRENGRKKIHVSKWMCVYALMAISIFVSADHGVWAIWFLALFGLVFLTPFSSEQLYQIRLGSIDGIVLGFFVLQGSAFVFRPFDDEHMRYSGIYANCNINALFYVVVFSAILFGIYIGKRAKVKWGILAVLKVLGAGVLAFTMLTIGKTAIITVIAVTFIYLAVGDVIILKQEIRKCLIQIVTYIFLACLLYPICFAAVRYLPPLFHHPVWFDGEYSEEKVHSWDPWDSEKYVDFDELIEETGSRIVPMGEWIVHDLLNVGKQAKESEETVVSGNAAANAERGEILTAEKAKTDTEGDVLYSAVGRLEIWNYALQHVKMWGHKYEGGYVINKLYIAYHVQNVFLQYLYYYGVPAAVFFVLWLYGVVRTCFGKIRSCPDAVVYCMLFLTVFVVYGLFEAVWYPAQMSLFMLHFSSALLLKE